MYMDVYMCICVHVYVQLYTFNTHKSMKYDYYLHFTDREAKILKYTCNPTANKWLFKNHAFKLMHCGCTDVFLAIILRCFSSVTKKINSNREQPMNSKIPWRKVILIYKTVYSLCCVHIEPHFPHLSLTYFYLDIYAHIFHLEFLLLKFKYLADSSKWTFGYADLLLFVIQQLESRQVKGVRCCCLFSAEASK